ncbi:MAG: metallophosphoesterase family protein [Candidatus Omnitrophota bacterium]|jgi:predicted phosphodiesterase
MRYGIFSDIHSNLEALDAVTRAYQGEGIDKYLCVGDIVGYAANPVECIRRVRELGAVIVAGNHDWASVGLLSVDYFNQFAREAAVWTGNMLDEDSRNFLKEIPLVYKGDGLTLAHGTLDDPGDFNYMLDPYAASLTFALLETVICFVGHTHVPGVFIESKEGILCKEGGNTVIEKGNKYIINTGSVGQPRDEDPRAAYCIYDTDKKSVEIKRTSYDIQGARESIISAGLPGFLGERLLKGR